MSDKGPNDLEETIAKLKKQVEFLQGKCRQAGERIKDLEEINLEEFNKVWIDKIEDEVRLVQKNDPKAFASSKERSQFSWQKNGVAHHLRRIRSGPL